MKTRQGFRAWFYFRNGWSMYFAFIFAAINTLTVTYYLAIERVPILVTIFPTFIHYVVIATIIGIPLLVGVGYAHWKKTRARQAEVDIGYETDPYKSRMLLNSQLNVIISIRLMDTLLRVAKKDKLSENDVKEIEDQRDALLALIEKGPQKNSKDLDFIKKELDKIKFSSND